MITKWRSTFADKDSSVVDSFNKKKRFLGMRETIICSLSLNIVLEDIIVQKKKKTADRIKVDNQFFQK